MTKTAGSAIAGYHGVIRDRGLPIWTCKHTHATTEEARRCATAEEIISRVFSEVAEKAAKEALKPSD